MSENERHPGEIYSGVELARPSAAVRPAYLLADSQLLFWKEEGRPWLERVRGELASPSPLAAYVGASNGDDPAYYSIFEAAMDQVGISERRRIPSELEAADLDFIDRAHLILLSGGDVARGWRAFVANGLSRILLRRYQEGALLMGVSAGAVQLGLGAPDSGGGMVDTFRILPYAIGAHEEAEGWRNLAAAVGHYGEHVRGYGVASGGGLVYYPDHSLEPLRRPLVELRLRGEEVRETLLMPGEGEPEEPEGPSEKAEEEPEEDEGDVLVLG